MSTITTPIAIVELNSQTDILANLAAIEAGVMRATQQQRGGQGAKLVVLPENAFGFGNQAQVAKFFEPLSQWCGKLARHYNVHLLAGTLPCPYRPNGTKVADGKFRQSSLLYDPSGDAVARYDKIHLFRATVNDSTGSYDESQTFEAGDTPVVAQTALGNIGMMVCFDLRFPTLALKLRQLGADILTAPSAFTYQTGKAHWQSLLTARALDSQCLVIGAGQAGEHFFGKQGEKSRQTWGHSEFVNANGEGIGEAMSLDNSSFDSEFVLTNQAQSWLGDVSNGDTQLTALLANTRLVMATFDPQAQQNWRCQLPIADCTRFATHDLLERGMD